MKGKTEIAIGLVLWSIVCGMAAYAALTMLVNY
jgi:hypothetical protein